MSAWIVTILAFLSLSTTLIVAGGQGNHRLPGWSNKLVGPQAEADKVANSMGVYGDTLVKMARDPAAPLQASGTAPAADVLARLPAPPMRAWTHFINGPDIVVYLNGNQAPDISLEIARLDGAPLPGEGGNGMAGRLVYNGGRPCVYSPTWGSITQCTQTLPGNPPAGSPIWIIKRP